MDFITPKLKKDFINLLLTLSVVGNIYQFTTYSNKVSEETAKEIQSLIEDRALYQKSYMEVANRNIALREELTSLKESIVASTVAKPVEQKVVIKRKPKVIQVPVYEIMEK